MRVTNFHWVVYPWRKVSGCLPGRGALQVDYVVCVFPDLWTGPNSRWVTLPINPPAWSDERWRRRQPRSPVVIALTSNGRCPRAVQPLLISAASSSLSLPLFCRGLRGKLQTAADQAQLHLKSLLHPRPLHLRPDGAPAAAHLSSCTSKSRVRLSSHVWKPQHKHIL